jgi:hypothetical protein
MRCNVQRQVGSVTHLCTEVCKELAVASEGREHSHAEQ